MEPSRPTRISFPIRRWPILCSADQPAAGPFLAGARSWAAAALADQGVSLEIVSLPDPVDDEIRAAQQRQ
jgi:hypothetical protein